MMTMSEDDTARLLQIFNAMKIAYTANFNAVN